MVRLRVASSDRWCWLACLAFAICVCGIGFLRPDLAIAKKNSRQSAATEIPVSVSVRIIDRFHRTGLKLERHGKLKFLGGLELSSSWPRFGGWSDLVVDRDGARMLAVSDDGYWMRGTLVYRGGKLVGLKDTRRGELRALSGRLLKGKRERDAEGVVLVSGTIDQGNLLISFERIHRIGKFKSRSKAIVGPSQYLKLPAGVRSLSRNKGLESVGIVRGGRHKGAVVAIGERRRGRKGGKRGGGGRPGWVFGRNGVFDFQVKDIGDMDVTSVAGLANGDLIILERRFRWSEGVRMRLRRILAKDVRAGAEVRGDILLEADMGYEIDNMEGLAVHRGAGGETILTLISDDNFNRVLQRTVMLQFQLEEGAAIRSAGGK